MVLVLFFFFVPTLNKLSSETISILLTLSSVYVVVVQIGVGFWTTSGWSIDCDICPPVPNRTIRSPSHQEGRDCRQAHVQITWDPCFSFVSLTSGTTEAVGWVQSRKIPSILFSRSGAEWEFDLTQTWRTKKKRVVTRREDEQQWNDDDWKGKTWVSSHPKSVVIPRSEFHLDTNSSEPGLSVQGWEISVVNLSLVKEFLYWAKDIIETWI